MKRITLMLSAIVFLFVCSMSVLFEAVGLQSQAKTFSEAEIDTVPRVYMAGDSHMADWTNGLVTLSKNWQGHFGLDWCYLLAPGINGAKIVTDFKNAGFDKIVYEGHKTYPYWHPDTSLFLKSINGKISRFYPAHGEDVTQPQIFEFTKTYIGEIAKEGFSEFLLIDYVWPWDARLGYGANTVSAFRGYLNGMDDGMALADGKGGYTTFRFWDYVKLYTDVAFSPADLGLSSWNEYTPVAENTGSKNYFLFNALYHYAHVKYLQKCGDYALSQGIFVQPTLNPESMNNAVDNYVMARLRGVGKLGYEYFGNPILNNAWYHTMRYFTSILKKYGHQMSCIGEINGGGHGPTRYCWDVAYAHYYDMTSSTKPVDYNVQYLEADWSATPKTDSYQFPRYAHWACGAYGFLQSHSENPVLQPARNMVVVSSRPILESSGGFADDLSGLSKILDELHYPFDASGKEEFGSYAKDAKVLVYCPGESSPMHLKAVTDWLNSSSGRVLVTHSYVPFKMSGGTLKSTLPLEKQSLSLKLGPVNTQSVSIAGGGKATKEIYALTDGVVVIRSPEGLPLITKVNYGRNKILYVNVDISSGNGAFEQEIVRQVMALAGVLPEVDAPTGKGVHLYSVTGGKSAVIWDNDTLAAQGKFKYYNTNGGRQYYYRAPLPSAGIAFNVEPNTTYKVYDFYANTTNMVTSTDNGKLTFKSDHSVDIIYFGKANDPGFANTLKSAQNTRKNVSDFEYGYRPTDRSTTRK